ncbi:hypothetical protein BH10ACI3_BH10ACI3_03820 [soil metagenome]
MMNGPAILAIRPDDSFSRTLRENGFEVVNLELIRTEPVSDLSGIMEMIRRIDAYDGIFITSPVAANLFLDHLKIEGKSYSGKVYVLGDRSRDSLCGSDLNVVYVDQANTAGELIKSLGEREFAGKHLLFIRGDRSVRTIPEILRSKAKVDELIVYRTIDNLPDENLIKGIADRIKRKEIERVCFFSPSGVKGFIKIFGAEDFTKIKGSAIGETTAASARESGINIEFISKRATAEDFASGLAAFIKSIE